MASTELTKQCFEAINLLQEIKAATLETKEYGADWLGSGKTVNRQGGRFAPKNGGDSSVDVNDPYYKAGKNMGRSGSTKQSLERMESTVDQMEKALKGLTEEERLRLDEYVNSSAVKKATESTQKGVDSVNPVMGEYFKKTNDALLGGLKKNRTVTDVLKKAKMELQDLGKIISKNPEYAVAGTVLAAGMVLGGIGAVALFSLPNLIGLGGVFSGITAIAQGAAAAEVAQAFAVGGLSQLGFSLSAYLMLNGAYGILNNLSMLEMTRFNEVVAPIGAKVAIELDQKLAWEDKKSKAK